MVEAVWEEESPRMRKGRLPNRGYLVRKPTSDGVRPAHLGGPASWRAV